MGMSFYTWIKGTQGSARSGPDFNNRNAGLVLQALGYTVEDGFFSAPLAEFAARAAQWLQKSLGQRSEEVQAQDLTGDIGPVWIEAGLREGYMQERIHDLSVFANEGKVLGHSEIYGA